jgi:hypothetical protein
MDIANLDEAGKKALRDFCGELSASMSRVEGERDFQREAVKKFAEDFEIDKKILKQTAKIYHKQNFHTVSGEQHMMEQFYRQIFGIENA